MPLFRIVDDLMRDRALRSRFMANPEAVVTEYALSDRERRILLTMDKTIVADHVPKEMKQEVLDYEMPKDEFRPTSEDFMAELGGIEPQYPSPAPGVFRYRTNPPLICVKAKENGVDVIHRGISAEIINTTSGVSFELVVYAQSFHDAKLKLVRIVNNVPEKEATDTHFEMLGTFRQTVLRAVFTPPNGEPAWVEGEKYEVTVVNNPEASGQLKKVFKAKPLLVVLK